MTAPLGKRFGNYEKKRVIRWKKLAELSDSSKSYIWELENKNPPRPSAEKSCEDRQMHSA